MALEQICGVNKLPFMKRFETTTLERGLHDLQLATCNFTNPYQLLAPPFERPAENLPKILARSNLRLDIAKGTTTLGFRYQGGIVLCADSRATSGAYVGSQTMKKIVELNDYMLGTLAGGAADCVYWDRVLARECRLHELRYRRRITVDTAARIMCNICTEYKGMGLSMGMMLAGCDDEGVKLCYVDSEGMRTHGNVFCVGSGSPYALGVLDTGYKWELSNEEAYDLGRRAIHQATCKDAYSGGIVRLYHINTSGWRNVANTDSAELDELYTCDEDVAAVKMGDLNPFVLCSATSSNFRTSLEEFASQDQTQHDDQALHSVPSPVVARLKMGTNKEPNEELKHL